MYSERKLSEYMAEPSASRGTKTASSGTYATNEGEEVHVYYWPYRASIR